MRDLFDLVSEASSGVIIESGYRRSDDDDDDIRHRRSRRPRLAPGAISPNPARLGGSVRPVDQDELAKLAGC